MGWKESALGVKFIFLFYFFLGLWTLYISIILYLDSLREIGGWIIIFWLFYIVLALIIIGVHTLIFLTAIYLLKGKEWPKKVLIILSTVIVLAFAVDLVLDTGIMFIFFIASNYTSLLSTIFSTLPPLLLYIFYLIPILNIFIIFYLGFYKNNNKKVYIIVFSIILLAFCIFLYLIGFFSYITHDCGGIRIERLKNECYFNDATKSKDISACDNIQTRSAKDECYFNLVFNGVITDLSICKKIQIRGFVNGCYEGIAESLKNISICGYINDTYERDLCASRIQMLIDNTEYQS